MPTWLQHTRPEGASAGSERAPGDGALPGTLVRIRYSSTTAWEEQEPRSGAFEAEAGLERRLHKLVTVN